MSCLLNTKSISRNYKSSPNSISWFGKNQNEVPDDISLQKVNVNQLVDKPHTLIKESVKADSSSMDRAHKVSINTLLGSYPNHETG